MMGIMLAALISGAILSNMVSSWHSAKYLFMVNLRLTDYIKGAAPPIEGMRLAFRWPCWLSGGLQGFLSLFLSLCDEMSIENGRAAKTRGGVPSGFSVKGDEMPIYSAACRERRRVQARDGPAATV